MERISSFDDIVMNDINASTSLPTVSRVALWFAWYALQCSQRRNTRAKLAQLDYHLLDDIGLSPADALRESQKWFWEP